MGYAHQRVMKWLYPRHDPAFCAQIAEEFSLCPSIAQIFVSRGFLTLEDIHNYLYAQLSDVPSPSLLPNIDLAIQRIRKAIGAGEHILIYGDNDVDGMTSVALMVSSIEMVGGNAHYHIPSRVDHKSNTLSSLIDHMKHLGCSLVITVDCGITLVEPIAQLMSMGIDVIVTDHHEPMSILPECTAIVNPKLVGSRYPDLQITGVGVAFKLINGLVDSLIAAGDISSNLINFQSFLDLVVLGTVADMGNLLGENRIFVKYGLSEFSKNNRPGLCKLAESSGLDMRRVCPGALSKISARLNSMGRISDSNKGVRLLLTNDDGEALKLVSEVEDQNIERQRLEKIGLQIVEHILIDNPKYLDHKALVLFSPRLHPGIIPILSMRMSRRYNKPTIVIANDVNALCKGSARSVGEFSIFPALHSCASILQEYGGHEYAAGLSINEGEIEEFRRIFVDTVDRTITQADLDIHLQLDARIQFSDLNFDFLESLRLLEPYGIKNPAPICYTDAILSRCTISGKYAKLHLHQDGSSMEGVYVADKSHKWVNKRNTHVRVAFTVKEGLHLDQSQRMRIIVHDILEKK